MSSFDSVLPQKRKNDSSEIGGASSSADPAEKDTGTKLSPYGVFLARLKEAEEKYAAKGSAYIVGAMDDDDEEEEEDEEEEDDEEKLADKCTQAQVDRIRVCLITENREKEMNAASKFVSCGQSGFMMFDTQSGNQVIMGIPKQVQKAMKKKTLSERFDALFGLTFQLNYLDFWINDNELWQEGDEMDQAISLLGKKWKALLKSSNDELGIDEEFTRPGTIALLSALNESISSVSNTAKLQW
eukprot:CAMPEP_0174968664 /NCGR_PEP_ID=MMETSP0004_2-20121128/8267_1 /TAXON_ID=420556 /ORGANISM="Ochromonas sp., Strain CCMP1393" /LENGTH=241 /DNA_ID=CAMNT_0016217937 /DNA_START=20 /DNA_END=745 /DNA_ORIENTATION=-